MKKILIAEFKHETNTFAKNKTDESSFRERDYLFGKEILSRFSGAKNELGAFIKSFEGEDFELVPIIAFNAQPGGIVCDSLFSLAKNEIISALSDDICGVLLALHGAMVTESSLDAEGDLLKAIRAFSPDIPIIATLDLHANLTNKMIKNANAFFPYDYYPHTDTFEAGIRAAECMKNTLCGRIFPTVAYSSANALISCIPTASECLRGFVEKAQSLRAQKGVINVNICHGFFRADIPRPCLSVVAVTDNDPQKAQTIASSLASELFSARESLTRRLYSCEDAINEALSSENKPFVFADGSDNPGSGATGDSPAILKALLKNNIKNAVIATIFDRETVQFAEKSGIGANIRIHLGGKIEPDITGEPLDCEATVLNIVDGRHFTKDYCPGTLTDLGKTAVLDISGITVLVASNRAQAWDLEIFRVCGLDPADYKIIVVKSAAHYKASYGKIAYKCLDVDAPATAAQTPFAFKYKNLLRPVYPLDRI